MKKILLTGMSGKVMYGFVSFILITFIFFIVLSLPPSNFPEHSIVSVKQGSYLSEVASDLYEQKIIKSPLLLKILISVSSGHREVKAGDYLFEEPQSVIKVSQRLIKGLYGLPKIKVTLSEGMTVKTMGSLLKKLIPGFDLEKFAVLAGPYEGYLFPDTYFFYENTSTESIVAELRENFRKKIKTQLLAIQASGKSIEDVIKMASIVEKEARDLDDKKIIAGILWKRIEIGMPLQVDAPFYYTLGKDSASLSMSDLESNSAYNTYKNKGLPPSPISNPGMESIEATLNPTKTKYLFFLSDNKGDMHYAIDHEGHVTNKQKYLR